MPTTIDESVNIPSPAGTEKVPVGNGSGDPVHVTVSQIAAMASGATSINGLSDAITNNASGSVYLGSASGQFAGSTSGNTAVGVDAYGSSSAGTHNTAIGTSALGVTDNIAASGNTAVGYQAGVTITSGSNNTLIGSQASSSSGAGVNRIAIGYNAVASTDNTAKIGNNSITDVYFGDGTAILHGTLTGAVISNNVVIPNAITPVSWTQAAGLYPTGYLVRLYSGGIAGSVDVVNMTGSVLADAAFYYATTSVGIVNHVVDNIDGVYDNGASGVGATLTTVETDVSGWNSVSVSDGDTILVSGQDNANENGLYEVSGVGVAIILTRITDFDSAGDALAGAYVKVLGQTAIQVFDTIGSPFGVGDISSTEYNVREPSIMTNPASGIASVIPAVIPLNTSITTLTQKGWLDEDTAMRIMMLPRPTNLAIGGSASWGASSVSVTALLADFDVDAP